METETWTSRLAPSGPAECVRSGRCGQRCAYMLLLLVVSACTPDTNDANTLFSLLTADETSIEFSNTVTDEEGLNILDYLYFYDGGGVALGDINKDGLIDVYFSGNQVSNKLYLNRGDLKFEDITDAAGVGGSTDEWSTGVTMADVDGDGWLDIYVCQVNYRTKKGNNLLYVNNRDGTYTEKAQTFGLDFEGLSTQASFFDYDRDGDLDLYLLNHSVHTRDSFGKSWRRIIDAPRVGDRLYRNDGGRFTNVTSEAGIYSSILGYGLGIAVSDLNHDGWPDIYVGNDFHENDYLYFNNRDGTFSEGLQRVIGHTSQSSMGNDVADVNNDGRVDIVSLDMLPEDLATYRRSGGPDPDELARIKRSFGYAPQYARNTLQLNRGFDEDGLPLYSEIGLYAGVHATDWSWAGLLTDLDNDGWKDLYVTNGILRRPNDLDYVDYISRSDIQRILNEGSVEEQLAVTERMPSVEMPNYAFANNGDLTFADRSDDWGLSTRGYSNGAAYGDLDNDGDVDLVVNNVNMPAFVYRNNTDSMSNRHFLRIELEGEGRNTTGIGTKVFVHVDGRQLYQEQMPTRGFQSSVSHVLHFGLGAARQVDSLLVIWPDGSYQRLRSAGADQALLLRQSEAEGTYSYERQASGRRLFRDATSEFQLDFVHRENAYVDDERQPLMPHALSTQGPALAVADVNGDGLDDFYIGGAHHQSGRLFIQQPGRSELLSTETPFSDDSESEDVDAAFFDADGDADLDLYVVSGGGQFPTADAVMQDRLYVNDGSGRFTRSRPSLPELHADGCCVAPGDYDDDGDVDVFVGSRSVPGSYGVSPSSHLLENDGAGTFKNATQKTAAGLLDVGMVTDALWSDVDGDESLDLVIAGEWMPVSVFRNANGKLTDVTGEVGLSEWGGWWNSILADDFDGDGDVDLVAGNLGANSVFRVSASAPLELFVHDFDGNGTSDPIIAESRQGSLYSWARRDELLEQMPGLSKKLSTYASYADLTLEDLFDAETIRASDRKTVRTLKSSYFENLESSGFIRRDMPAEAQFSPVMDLTSHDFNGDGNKDIISVGNFLGSDTKQGRYDADYGTLLLGDGKGNFARCSVETCNLVLRGEVRAIGLLRLPGGEHAVLIARSNHSAAIFRVETQ